MNGCVQIMHVFFCPKKSFMHPTCVHFGVTPNCKTQDHFVTMTEDVHVIQVQSFDGLMIWLEKNVPFYEIGNFLGNGAAGTVYEAEQVSSKKRYAMKILNPIGYKILSPHQLRSCTVVVKGKPFPENLEKSKEPIGKDYFWWLVNGSTKQFHAAYFSEKQRSLKELSLSQCINIWGTNPEGFGEDGNDSVEIRQCVDGTNKVIPVLPSRFFEFLKKRVRIFREIRNMKKVSNHPNVIRLESVLELTQDSKCTIFLVMELANGGELFDRIKVDFGTREDTARLYFNQLLLGVRHCHEQGVCHRDLKPENLLLSDTKEYGTILKVADFGFSARVMEGIDPSTDPSADVAWSPDDRDRDTGVLSLHATSSSSTVAAASVESFSLSPLRNIPQLTSVVGSPFYVAPEVLQARGYNGLKADMWSLGVILYAMLAGNLPFGQDHFTCKRFRDFSSWVRSHSMKDPDFCRGVDNQLSLDYPSWLFPAHFSMSVRGLIVSMLHPDPMERISVVEAQEHPWCRDNNNINADNDGGVSELDKNIQEKLLLNQYHQNQTRHIDDDAVEDENKRSTSFRVRSRIFPEQNVATCLGEVIVSGPDKSMLGLGLGLGLGLEDDNDYVHDDSYQLFQMEGVGRGSRTNSGLSENNFDMTKPYGHSPSPSPSRG
eukprot:gene7597-15566_t